jgi:hypothetical protein
MVIRRWTVTDPNRCRRCELPHPRCAGHNKAGLPCMMYPRTGATVCKRHGGHAPQVIAAAERRRQEAEAAAAAVTYGLPIKIDPAQALLEEVHRSAGAVAWLGAIVAGMEQSDLVWGVVEQTVKPAGPEGGGGVETKSKAVPNVWLTLYRDERKHLAAVSRDALGADAAGRVAAVFEQIGSAYIAMFDRVLGQLELTEAQRTAIPGILVAELQALPGGRP